uniref:Ribonuclease H n=1 Tax=Crithidia fasciculata TaxID=5656 RepID=RNH1_CRIFA|nr:RecName: Full=Ribonuclease H; Short=RNase H [Crithidia fasciculata]AAA03546.1 ribonuclease H [Crithidia fasciculata]
MRRVALSVLFQSSRVLHFTDLRDKQIALCNAAPGHTVQFHQHRRHSSAPVSSVGGQNTFSCLGASCAGLLHPSRVRFANRRRSGSTSKKAQVKSSVNQLAIPSAATRERRKPKLSNSCAPAVESQKVGVAPTTSRASGETRTSCAPPPASRMKPSFYVVAVGRQRGIYSTWDQCSEQVKGFSGAVYKSFRTLSEARAYLTAHPARSGLEKSDRGDGAASLSALSEPQVGLRRSRAAEAEASYVVEAPAQPTLRQRVEEEVPSGAAAVQRAESSVPQVVYVDGACSHNGTPKARAGYGGFYGSTSDSRNFSLPVPITEAQTNNRGEMRAVIHCIVQGFVDAGVPPAALGTSHCVEPDWELSELPQPLRRLVIYTDSRYVIDGLTRYALKWVANGFKLASKEPVLNQDLWRQLIRLRDAYNTRYAEQQHWAAATCSHASTRVPAASQSKRFHTHNTRNDETEGIELRHVKGHSNDYGNEMADVLAVAGARMHGTSE